MGDKIRIDQRNRAGPCAAPPRAGGLAGGRVAWRTAGAALCVLLWAAAAAAGIRALEIGVSSRLRASELELALTGRTEFRAFTLDAPRRAVVDLRGLDWSDLRAPAPAGGPVSAVRIGVVEPGWARIVLDLDAPMVIARAGFHPGPDGVPRFRLRLVPSDPARFAALSGAPPGARWQPAVRPGPPAAPPGAAAPTVVLDPGHGGIDPGALRDGLVEKEIALAAARAIAARLARDGRFRPVLTREGDAFVPLAERVRIAREAGARAFISIHVNSEPTGLAEGISVFTLSESASDRAAERLAMQENRADLLAGLDLEGETSTVARVLIDLARSGTNLRARRLAEAMIAVLAERGRPMGANPHRHAGFHVLNIPDVPAVLVELGFLTSAADRARLAAPEWVDAVARDIVAALDRWQAEEERRLAAGR
ncbi:MAG: N-acetylmuramoyl-L-alanine amidase [Paracoccaceae bacterium]|nr:MAG: N-acetylmuramoyl-L-alanine amidase [Paracoccaceae bacterium]